MSKHKFGKTGVVLATLAVTMSGVACSSSAKSSSPGSGVASATKGASTATGTPWVIGTIGAYSGVFASQIGPAKSAMQAWVAQVNASGGINGHPLKLIVEDDGGDASKSLTNVKKLVEQDHVIAIVGSADVDNSSYASYLDQKQVPMVGGLSTGPIWDTNPSFFPSMTSANSLYSAVAALLHGAGGKKFGVVSCTENPTCLSNSAIASKTAKTLGMKPVFTQMVKTGLADYTSVCLAAKQAGVDAFAILDASSVVESIMSSCARQNYKPLVAVQGASVGFASTLKNPAEQGALVLSEVFPFFSTDTPEQTTFQTAMTKYGGGQTASAISAIAYAGGALFKAAAEAGKLGDNPTGADVINGLYALPHGSSLGNLVPPLSYQKGQPKILNCYYSFKVGNGKFELGEAGSKPICPA